MPVSRKFSGSFFIINSLAYFRMQPRTISSSGRFLSTKSLESPSSF